MSSTCRRIIVEHERGEMSPNVDLETSERIVEAVENLDFIFIWQLLQPNIVALQYHIKGNINIMQ